MTNTWSYDVLLGSRAVTPAAISSAATLAEERGYALTLPAVVTTSEGEEVEYVDRDSFFEGMSRHGGLASLSRDSDLQAILLDLAPAANRIGFGTLRELRAESTEERRRLVGDLETLFFGLCRQLKPVYGYSTDEWRLDAAFGDASLDVLAELERRTRCGEPPNVLFWLNYFDAAYWREIGEHRLWIGAKYTPLDDGMLVHLADEPADALLATLGEDGRYHVV